MCKRNDPATEVEWLRLRRLRVEGQAGVSEEDSQQIRSVLDALESALDDGGEVVHAGCGENFRAVLTCDHTASVGLKSGAWAGSRTTCSQSLLAIISRIAALTWGVECCPTRARSMPSELVGGIEQGRVLVGDAISWFGPIRQSLWPAWTGLGCGG